MAVASSDLRNRSFGQEYDLTVVDRFGIWLSARRMGDASGGFAGKRVADVGCGYHATFGRTLLGRAAQLTLVDLALSPEVKAQAAVTAIEGTLPQALAEVPDASQDVVVCNSVLEHLWDPATTLSEFHRIVAAGGVVLLNVPSWRGKRFLEFSAYRLGLSPASEMDDHKTYYDPSDLWPLLVRAGFAPRDIRCFKHKFGLNTFAICRRGSSTVPAKLGQTS